MFEVLTDDTIAQCAGPCTCALPDDEVHVWQVNLDKTSSAVLRRARTVLSDDEVVRAERFYQERDRRRFIIGRGLLRRLLGWYMDLDPRHLKFCYGVHGKPRLAAPAGSSEIFFNATHSGPLALFAVTRVGEVGIDVERVREISEWKQIAATCFAPFERERLRLLLPPGGRQEEFFRIWTRHEAMLKAAGSGLGERPGLNHKFSLHSLRLASDCVAALALSGRARRIRYGTLGDGIDRAGGPS
jgi:4'-phosphopantetheinyl transferase